MTRQWTQEELEALVYGELEPDRAAELERLAERDDECARELALLRAERGLMARRAERLDADADPAALWSGIAGRIAEAGEPAEPWWRRLLGRHSQGIGIGVAVAGAAAVALLAVTGPGGSGDVARSGPASAGTPDAAAVAPDPVAAVAADAHEVGGDAGAAAPDETDALLDEASMALAQAEMSYLQALDALEKAYRAQRDSLAPELAAQYDQEFAAARKSIAAAGKATDLHSRRRLLSAYSQQVMSLQAAIFDAQEARQ